MLCFLTQYINIVSLDQEMIFYIKFQYFLIFLPLPGGVQSKAKLNNSGESVTFFDIIRKRNCIRQIFSRTLIQISFKHILISLTVFKVTPL